MKKKWLIIIGVILVAVVLVLALKPFAKKETATSFETVKVEKGNISNTVTATGTIQAIKDCQCWYTGIGDTTTCIC